MRRMIPFIKMTLRMTVFGLALGAVLGLLVIALFGATVPPGNSHIFLDVMKSEMLTGLVLGAVSGVAMALYTGLLHRNVHNPQSFRFALVIVGTVASLALIEAPLGLSFLVDDAAPMPELIRYASYDISFALLLLGAIGKHAAIALMSWYAAGRYLKEA